MRYDHTQTAPWYLGLLALGALSLAGAVAAPLPWEARCVTAASALVMGTLAMAFKQLTVRDERDHLRIAFGPLPLLSRKVVYDEIEAVERCRTGLVDGWGVHFGPGAGWIWNIWGYDCVALRLSRGRRLRIGTDDAAGLEAFLLEELATRTPPADRAARGQRL